MTDVIRIGPDDYGILVHSGGAVDLLIDDHRKPLPDELQALIGAFLKVRSGDEMFTADCREAFETFHAVPANQMLA